MQIHMQSEGMKSKNLVFLLMLILLVSSINLVTFSENVKSEDPPPKFYVDDNYDGNTPGWQIDHFDIIQDAIDAAQPGDRIIVYAGTYNENLMIDKRLDIFGEDREITYIDGSDSGDVIQILAENINVSHFTIRDSGNNVNDAIIKINSGHSIITDNKITSGRIGIFVSTCDNNIIYDNIINDNNGNGIWLDLSDNNDITYNTITNNNNGIFLYSSSSNTIENNPKIQSNDNNGIFLNDTCNYNKISSNNITSNDENGIYLHDHCNYNTISNNDIFSNSNSGMRLENSSWNLWISNNEVKSNTNYGIMIVGSNNILNSNTISNNKKHGIFLFADNNNTVSENLITGSTNDGINMSNSTSDYIYNNEIYGNSEYGLFLDYFSISNKIYNNYFHDNSVKNAMDKSINSNNWNLPQSGQNIIGGPIKNGNYWDDYDEISEGAYDNNNDGIADSPYTIYASNKDNGPLIDVTLPVIGTPQVSPSTQAIGSTTTISATITDNIEIREVWINITKPNGLTTNFSITANKTGNVYTRADEFSPIGNYTFVILAKDPRNWKTSATGSFYIHKGQPPSITDRTPSSGSPSSSFTFNATVTSGETSASDINVSVIWSHGSKSGNNSMINTIGNYFEKTITLDASIQSINYYFYAVDKWGNAVTTQSKSVSISDTQAPIITIEQHSGSSGAYTFAVKVTDDAEVDEVTIEYWYNGSDKMTTIMDNDLDTGSSYYKKVIFPPNDPGWVYCVIYAKDKSGNQRDTKNPYAHINGPYQGYVSYSVQFDGTKSYDLDGTLAEYTWDFGDGTSGTGIKTSHIYPATGTYSISLTVKDNEEKTNTDTSYVVISTYSDVKATNYTLDEINNRFGVNLENLFYAYDTDGDGIVNSFSDPNGILDFERFALISNQACFLISINDNLNNLFIWNSDEDSIENVTYSIPIDTNKITDGNSETVTITINKANWTYFSIDDEYSDVTDLTVKRLDGTTVSSDMIWRENNKIFVLDDPSTQYQFIYSGIVLLKNGIYNPATGGVIDQYNQTITITYDTPVTVMEAEFYNFDTNNGIDIASSLVSTDGRKTVRYTPASYLANGRYELYLWVIDEYGNEVKDSAIYDYYSYTSKIEEKADATGAIIFFGLFMAGGIVFLLLIRFNKISLDSFIYFKNKKIIPFIKPIIFGPMTIDVNDDRISKAEFYVNGKLKDTLTEPPYVWKWNETTFMKNSIETKVYDDEGNSASSGKMTFYIFNYPKLFK